MITWRKLSLERLKEYRDIKEIYAQMSMFAACLSSSGHFLKAEASHSSFVYLEVLVATEKNEG